MIKTVEKRHFTTAVFILHPFEQRVLLLMHKKIHHWLPPGGHLDENEEPSQGARREVIEETGLEISFLPQDSPSTLSERVVLPPQAHHFQVEKIEENHFHLDFVFLARATNAELTNPESHDLRWFSKQEINALPENQIFSETREMALKVLQTKRRP